MGVRGDAPNELSAASRTKPCRLFTCNGTCDTISASNGHCSQQAWRTAGAVQGGCVSEVGRPKQGRGALTLPVAALRLNPPARPQCAHPRRAVLALEPDRRLPELTSLTRKLLHRAPRCGHSQRCHQAHAPDRDGQCPRPHACSNAGAADGQRVPSRPTVAVAGLCSALPCLGARTCGMVPATAVPAAPPRVSPGPGSTAGGPYAWPMHEHASPCPYGCPAALTARQRPRDSRKQSASREAAALLCSGRSLPASRTRHASTLDRPWSRPQQTRPRASDNRHGSLCQHASRRV